LFVGHPCPTCSAFSGCLRAECKAEKLLQNPPLFWGEMSSESDFRIGAGMLFVTKFVEAVFLCPAGIFIFARCGLTADLSFFIDFYGLTLFAAGSLNNSGVNDGGGCFLYF